MQTNISGSVRQPVRNGRRRRAGRARPGAIKRAGHRTSPGITDRRRLRANAIRAAAAANDDDDDIVKFADAASETSTGIQGRPSDCRPAGFTWRVPLSALAAKPQILRHSYVRGLSRPVHRAPPFHAPRSRRGASKEAESSPLPSPRTSLFTILGRERTDSSFGSCGAQSPACYEEALLCRVDERRRRQIFRQVVHCELPSAYSRPPNCT